VTESIVSVSKGMVTLENSFVELLELGRRSGQTNAQEAINLFGLVGSLAVFRSRDHLTI